MRLFLYLVVGILLSLSAFADNGMQGNGSINCANTNYNFCDDFSDNNIDSVKWDTPNGGTCTEANGRMSCTKSGGSSEGNELSWNSTNYRMLRNVSNWCVEWKMNLSGTASGTCDYHYQYYDDTGAYNGFGTINTFNANNSICNHNVNGNDVPYHLEYGQEIYYIGCYNGSNSEFVQTIWNATKRSAVNRTFTYKIPTSTSLWAILPWRDTTFVNSFEYLVSWNGTFADAPYLVKDPPVLSSFNMTSNGGCTVWNNNKATACNSTDSTPTVTFTTDVAANCAIGITNINYTTMGSSRNCSATGATSHTCTVIAGDARPLGYSNVYASCLSTDGVENATSSSGALNFYLIGTHDVNITPKDSLRGNTTYDVSFLINFPQASIGNCTFTSQAGRTKLSNFSYNATHTLCNATISMPFGENSFVSELGVLNSLVLGTNYSALKIRLLEYLADPLFTNNSFSRQYFVRSYLFNNTLAATLTNYLYSLNATTSNFTINVTSNSSHTDNQSQENFDLIEEKPYTISGTSFIEETGYSITREFVYNNTLNFTIPETTINQSLYSFNSALQIQQLNVSSFIPFNYTFYSDYPYYFTARLNRTNSSNATTYRQIYNAILVNHTGDSVAVGTIVGDIQRYVLKRNYTVLFSAVASGSTINESIATTEVPNWLQKTSRANTMQLLNGTTVTHTTTDNIVNLGTNVDVTWTTQSSDGNYSYNLTYEAPYETNQPAGGGGGGGGGLTIVKETVITGNGTTGKIQFDRQSVSFFVLYTPSSAEKNVVVQAIDGDVKGNLQLSNNLNGIIKAEICDPITDACANSYSLKKDQIAILKLTSTFNEELGNKLLVQPSIEGSVKFDNANNAQTLPLLVDRSPTYSLSYQISQATDGKINQALASFLLFALVGGLLIYLIYVELL